MTAIILMLLAFPLALFGRRLNKRDISAGNSVSARACNGWTKVFIR
jgi:hypothetical protein